jgi:phosphoribosyl 1,2-cyclic phosphate phosphodiesterase
MTVRLLGTGAAEGIPAFLSDTRVSLHAREKGGKDVRTRCAALLDGCVKIDLPPDTLYHIHRDRLDARDWTCLVFTHSHADHFAVEEIQYGLYPFSGLEYLCWTIYGNEAVCAKVAERYPLWPLDVVQIRSFEPFEHGPFRITPIRANHQDDEESLNLIFERDGKTLLYATDTGVWPEETWDFLRRFKLDGMVIECTEGLAPTNYSGHLSVKEVVEVVSRLRADGVLANESKVVTTHHSHNGEATHAELEAALGPHGIEVGYDGYELRV